VSQIKFWSLNVLFIGAGRKGAPGSGILILNEWGSEDEDCVGQIFDLKEERNRSEIEHVHSLMQDFQQNIQQQEKCFRRFAEHYTLLKSSCENNRQPSEISSILQLNVLDQWAFWLDAFHTQHCQKEPLESILKKLDQNFQNLETKVDKIENIISMIDNPTRRVTLAKLIANSARSDCYTISEKILDDLIESDPFWYPSAHYYKAFIIVNKTKNIQGNKHQFLKEMFAAENLITKHVDMQMSFIAIVSSTHAKEQTAFFPIEAYKKQKQNDIYLLELFLHSISNMIGRYCQVKGIITEGMAAEKAPTAFEILIKNNFINLCQVNPEFCVPSHDQVIENISFSYGVSPTTIKKVVQSAGGFTERQLEKKLNAAFEWTRKTFWTKLVQLNVLTKAQEVIRINPTQVEEHKLCLQEQILTEKYNIWYNPPEQSDNGNEEAVFFPKDYIKEMLGEEYQSKKKDFSSNKLAFLHKEKLSEIQNEISPKLQITDLERLGIDQTDAKLVWRELVQCGIIENHGTLKKLTGKWECSDCPLYGEPVSHILLRKFSVNFIFQAWLEPNGPNVSAITLLPMKPSRGLLDDLFSARVLSPPSVPDNDSVNLQGDGIFEFLKNKIWCDDLHEKIPDSKDREIILNYLRANQAAYANLETPIASLKPLRQQLQESLSGGANVDNINTELAIFNLIGFDDIFELNAKKWSNNMNCRASVILAIGLAQIVIGAVTEIWSLGALTNVASGLISEGISDILYTVSALQSGNNFTYRDYSRHKAESVLLTAAMMGFGFTFRKGIKSFNIAQAVVPSAAPGILEAAKKVVKTTASRVIQAITISIVHQQIAKLVAEGLGNYCEEVRKKIFSYLEEKLKQVQGLRQTLATLYQKCGQESHKVVSNCLSQAFNPVVDTWSGAFGQVLSKACGTLSNAYQIAMRKMSSSLLLSSSGPKSNWALLLNFAAVLAADCGQWFVLAQRNLSEKLNSFQKGLSDCLNERRENKNGNFSQKDSEIFIDASVEKLRTQLNNEAEKLVRAFTTTLLQAGASFVFEKINSSLRNRSRQHKANKLRKKFEQLKSEEREQSPGIFWNKSNRYLAACIKLMKKTRFV
jgi:hypothetical protein